MADSVHLSKKSNVRRHQQEIEQETLMIKSAKYINNFTIAISLTNGKTKLVDFLPIFHKYVKGAHLDYFSPQKFKKFIVKHGNIYWGEHEDVNFPVDFLLKKASQNNEKEILYII